MTVIGTAFIEIAPEVSNFASKLSTDVRESVDKVATASGASFDKIASVGQKAFLGVAAAAGVLGVAAVKAALEGQEAQAQLANAIGNTGVSYESVGANVEKLTQSQAKFGITNDEAEAALTRLVQTTGNTGASMDLLSTSVNLAAARHMDLTTAATLVGKAADGNVSALKRYGIQLQTTGDATKDGAAAVALLNERFGGAAQAQADTYAGKLKAFQAEMANLTEKIGMALLPVLGEVTSELGNAIGFFEHNEAAALALGLVIGGPLAVAMGAYALQEARIVASKLGEFLGSAGAAAKAMAAQFAEAGVASSLLLGATGLIIVALDRLVVSANKTQQAADDAAKAYAEHYVSSLDESSTRTENLKKHVNDLALQMYTQTKRTDEGSASFGVYEKALRDSKTATDASTAATEDASAALTETGGAVDTLSAKLGISREAVDALAKKLKIDLSKDATPEASAQLAQMVERLHDTSAVSLDLKDSLAKLADQTADATEKSKAFKTALDLLIGSNVDADKAVVTLYGTIDTLGQKLHDNGANLDYHTAKGRENISAIDDTVSAITNHIESLQRQGAAAADVQRAFEGDTAALRKQLEQAGYTKGQIQELIDRYKLVPSTLNTVITADFSSLYRAAAEAAAHIPFTVTEGLSAGVRVSGTVRTFDAGGLVDAPRGMAVPAIVHGGEFVLTPQMLAGAPIAGLGSRGGTVISPVVNLTVNIDGSADERTVQRFAEVARDEVEHVLTGVLDRAAAGSGRRVGT